MISEAHSDADVILRLESLSLIEAGEVVPAILAVMHVVIKGNGHT